MIWGTLLLLLIAPIGLNMVADAKAASIPQTMLGALVLVAVPVLLIRSGIKKKWYRYNA